MHAQTVSHGRDMHLVGEGEREEADVLEAYRLYSRELDRYPLLSPEQEQEVAVRAHRGDRQARQVLVCANLRLVLKVARDYRRENHCGSYGFLDLVQEGNLGLLRAVEKFDPSRGNRFSTHAVWWIRQAIGRFVAEQSAAVHLPSYVVEEWRVLRRGTEAEIREELLSG